MKKIECFKIRIIQNPINNDIFNISKGKIVKELHCLNPYLVCEPDTILADPFLFVNDEILYLFYESKKLYSHGVIKMISTKDTRKWSKPVVVLQENFHLSYPFVFEDNGKIYMIPETGEDRSIRLYVAENKNLSSFKFEKKLMQEKNSSKPLFMSYADSSIYKKNDIYYLMTTLQNNKDENILELYYSGSLSGVYRKHPMSPIVIEQKIGRNAGSLLEHNNKLYRVSQDCTHRYGDNVNVSEILALSPFEYKEKLVLENIIDTNIDFYKEGGHHFNMVSFHNKNIISTDAKEYNTMAIHRIIHKLKYK